MVPLLVVLQGMLQASCCHPHRLWQDLCSRGGASGGSVYNIVVAAATSTCLWRKHSCGQALMAMALLNCRACAAAAGPKAGASVSGRDNGNAGNAGYNQHCLGAVTQLTRVKVAQVGVGIVLYAQQLA